MIKTFSIKLKISIFSRLILLSSFSAVSYVQKFVFFLTDVSSYIIKLGDNKPCILPEHNLANITDGTELVFSSKCAGTNFMFRFNEQNSLVHSISGFCLNMNKNSTAILTSNCSESAFEYKRISRGAFDSFNLIVKHIKTGRCVRFKREKGTQRIVISLRRCGDIFQMLLVLTKSGMYDVHC